MASSVIGPGNVVLDCPIVASNRFTRANSFRYLLKRSCGSLSGEGRRSLRFRMSGSAPAAFL